MKNKIQLSMLIMTLSALCLGIYTYLRVDQQIVIHWNIDNHADGFAPKIFLLIAPLFIPLIDFLLSLCRNIDPRRKNIKKSASVYDALRLMIAAVLFTACIITCIEGLKPGTMNIGLVITLLIGIIITLMGNIMPRVHSNHMIGIRNPWTLDSESVWRKTHRISGRLWFGGGLIICIGAFLSKTITLGILITVMLIITILPNIYAYLIYQQERKEQAHD